MAGLIAIETSSYSSAFIGHVQQFEYSPGGGGSREKERKKEREGRKERERRIDFFQRGTLFAVW